MTLRPQDVGFTTSFRPSLTWNAASDPDTGDEVTSYMVEFASNSANVGTVLAMYRVNVSSAQALLNWTVPADLELNKVYYWRVSARDRTGAVSNSGATQSFTVMPAYPFTPVVDAVKDSEWENIAKTEYSDLFQAPGRLCRTVYMTNDAGYLYVGWEAQGDPWDDSLSAIYTFAFETDRSTNGVATEPNRAGTSVGWTNKPDFWVNTSISYGQDSFGSMTLFKSSGAAWDTGTALTAGTDYNTSMANAWGEFRIPLKTLNLSPGSTVQMAHLFHAESSKPGVFDTTPYDNTGANSNGNSSSTVTTFLLYTVKYSTMNASHVPDSIPLAGQGTMRKPFSPDSADTTEIKISINPQSVFSSGTVRYSTGSVWSATNTVSFGEGSFSGGSEYRIASIPAMPKGTVVKYMVMHLQMGWICLSTARNSESYILNMQPLRLPVSFVIHGQECVAERSGFAAVDAG